MAGQIKRTVTFTLACAVELHEELIYTYQEDWRSNQLQDFPISRKNDFQFTNQSTEISA
jgi:hypothetical protein